MSNHRILRFDITKIKPDDEEVAIRSIRKTKSGAVLLELGKGGKKNDFYAELKGTMGEVAKVTELKPRAKIEIRDLDSLTTDDEVRAAVRIALQEPTEQMDVKISGANTREQRRAYVCISSQAAKTLQKTERIRMGLVRCRIKLLQDVERCYRCFETGHLQYNCKGPDRKGQGLCIRCGESGHKLKECTRPPKCCICASKGCIKVDHIPGSHKCEASKRI
ncbi:uncharacterized protein LOC119677245 [Teleopsis dalmanni]|uniref:uncharacterized protein LOC119675323 n=1 Tax=Teleopsis dalmanni TaxID=139649 RepID=UPI0018CE4982|nr:uncharacterized protein LOC119675323 [Teleopsis dalmanni]XP_037944292.1 uncharacterized protein LOC119677096 [Teleopsis dalmanni]XP_037944444.1 uncharacterized protein LOC119677245 [Teleopsis dalmanni]